MTQTCPSKSEIIRAFSDITTGVSAVGNDGQSALGALTEDLKALIELAQKCHGQEFADQIKSAHASYAREVDRVRGHNHGTNET